MQFPNLCHQVEILDNILGDHVKDQEKIIVAVADCETEPTARQGDNF